MKIHSLVLGLLLVIGVQFVQAQDMIVKIDGEEIEAKVEEIGTDVVKYRKFSNLTGPLYSLEKVKIFMIKYENGEKEVFGKTTEPEKAAKPQGTTAPDAEAKTTTTPTGSTVTTVTYSKRSTGDREVDDKEIFHALKIDPIPVIFGEIPIFYEHRLGDKISIEVGLGITHQNYYRGSVWYTGIYNDNFYNVREVNVGPTASVEFRFYPSEWTRALEDIYFGPKIKYKSYRTTLIDCGGSLAAEYDETLSFLDVELHVGYMSYFGDRVFADWYGGLGMRTINQHQYECTSNGATSIVTDNFQSGTKPVIAAGVRIGFGF